MHCFACYEKLGITSNYYTATIKEAVVCRAERGLSTTLCTSSSSAETEVPHGAHREEHRWLRTGCHWTDTRSWSDPTKRHRGHGTGRERKKMTHRRRCHRHRRRHTGLDCVLCSWLGSIIFVGWGAAAVKPRNGTACWMGLRWKRTEEQMTIISSTTAIRARRLNHHWLADCVLGCLDG